MKTFITRQVQKQAADLALCLMAAPAGRLSRAAECEKEDRDPANPWHWMPVAFPGLTIPQLEKLMQEVDRKPYTPPAWLTRRCPVSDLACQKPETDGLDRDPNDPRQWIPVPPPNMLMGGCE